MEALATILHADLDAFYASVEQLLDPSLRGKPIAVGGGVVLAASYEAKAFGVRGGMPGRRARELCPQLIFVGGHFKEYQRLGDAAIERAGRLHAAGRAHLHRRGVRRRRRDGASVRPAGRDRRRRSGAACATELGLPISVGVARTKHLAKIASQVAKPDGLVVVDPRDRARIPARPAGRADVGRRPGHQGAAGRDRRAHHRPAGAEPRRGSLERLLGRAARSKLAALAWNRDPREIKTHRRAQSAGAQSALGRKPADGARLPADAASSRRPDRQPPARASRGSAGP